MVDVTKVIFIFLTLLISLVHPQSAPFPGKMLGLPQVCTECPPPHLLHRLHHLCNHREENQVKIVIFLYYDHHNMMMFKDLSLKKSILK